MMRDQRSRPALLFPVGMVAMGVLALAWAVGSGPSEAQQGAMHNCPQPGNWAISVWSGNNNTAVEQAFATCGEGAVAAAYYIDPQTQAWSRWFAGRPGLSTLSTLNDMQGVLALGTAAVPPPAATPTPTGTTSSARIGFESDRDGYPNFEIYVMNADGTGQTNLSNNPAGDWYARWSPDGSKIAFGSDRDGQSEIYVMNPDGTGQSRLTNTPYSDNWPAWSPDGSKIKFVSDRDLNLEIYVMNPDGTEQTRLTKGERLSGGGAWSPDGSKIAFTAYTDLNMLDIYVINADGTGRARLTENPPGDWKFGDWFGDWSPDGSKIAFWSYRAGTRDIWVMNADGTNQTNLTSNSLKMDTGPVWSPDGSKIAFHRAGDIWLMNADGTEQVSLTNDSAQNNVCGWSPDGSKIAFISQRDFDGETYEITEKEIYVMNADGSDVTRLTYNQAWEGCGRWLP